VIIKIITLSRPYIKNKNGHFFFMKNYSKPTDDKIKDHSDQSNFNALELFNLKIDTVPKLVEPFFQKSGLASLVGTSDTVKSTFLRQLSLAIVLGKADFIGFKLNPKHHRVIYVSTEDGPHSVSHSIRKQIKNIQSKKVESSTSRQSIKNVAPNNDIIKEV